MSELGICVLISNDPDDHQIIFEALKAIDDKLQIVIMFEVGHATELITSRLLPRFVIIDTNLEPVSNTLSVINVLQNQAAIKVITLTEEILNADHKFSTGYQLSKRMDFPTIKGLLSKFINGA